MSSHERPENQPSTRSTTGRARPNLRNGLEAGKPIELSVPSDEAVRFQQTPPFVEVAMPAPLRDADGKPLAGQQSIGIQIAPHFHFPESASRVDMAAAMKLFGDSLVESLGTVFGVRTPPPYKVRPTIHVERAVAGQTACGLRIEPEGLAFVDSDTAFHSPSLVTCSACIDIMEGGPDGGS